MSDYYPYPKRDPIKNYFPLPNEIFLLGLTPGELAVYSSASGSTCGIIPGPSPACGSRRSSATRLGSTITSSRTSARSRSAS